MSAFEDTKFAVELTDFEGNVECSLWSSSDDVYGFLSGAVYRAARVVQVDGDVLAAEAIYNNFDS